MIELFQLIQSIVERGLIFSFMTISVYLSSRLINFDNLSVEGAFGIGGAITALLINWGINPWIALIGATFFGALSGVVTGLLNTQLKLNNLISGIVVTTGLFSITLKIAGSNMIISDKQTIFNLLPTFLSSYQHVITLIIIFFVSLFAISWFLKTEIGLLLQAVGDTPQMITNIGKNVDLYIIGGLVMSNSLAALSGALFVQYAKYFSIWTNVGVMIIGLAGMMLAQIVSKQFGLALLVGSIAYQSIIALTFELQVNQDWNKLITAILIVLLITMKQVLHKK